MADDKQIYLLPSAAELAMLSDEQAKASLEVLDRAHRREHSYAILAMVCGTVAFLSCIGVFAYLVVAGHPQAAGVVFGHGSFNDRGSVDQRTAQQAAIVTAS